MPINWQAFQLTIELAVVVSAILLAVGLPLAHWIAFSRWRWKFLVEALVAMPIVLPPTVLGFYLLVALGSQSPLGRWWQSLTGHTLAFTFTGLVIARSSIACLSRYSLSRLLSRWLTANCWLLPPHWELRPYAPSSAWCFHFPCRVWSQAWSWHSLTPWASSE